MLANIPDGAKIGIPGDNTNGARALLLLEAQGVLKLKEGVGLEATELDIEENPHNVEIVPMEAANLPASLPDLDFAVINGNYASGAGIVANCSPISQPFASTAPFCFIYALNRYFSSCAVMISASPNKAPHFVPPI